MPTLEELRRNRKPIESVNLKHRESFTRLERFAVWITDNIGTMGFFFIVFIWTVLWFLWNIFAPRELRFDPFPAFVLWLFISNMLQLFFLPLIMISQNLQERHAELRAENDFETNQKTEREVEAILEVLEKQGRTLSEISDKISKIRD